MDSNDTETVWIIGLIIVATFLFGGEPDLTDALIQFLTGANGGH